MPINNLLIEKVDEAVFSNNSGQVKWTAADVSSPKISVTSESKEKTDAIQNVISKIFQGKKAEISFESAFFSAQMIAAQSGTDIVRASSSSPIVTPFREVIKVGASSTTIKLGHSALTGSIKEIYVQEKDRSLGKSYAFASAAGANAFPFSGDTITLPTSGIKEGDNIVVYYEANVTDGIKVINTSDSKSDAGILRLYVLFKDMCDEDVKYKGVVEFPSAQISPDCEIGLAFDDTYSYTLSANKKYCSDTETLFTIYVPSEAYTETTTKG